MEWRPCYSLRSILLFVDMLNRSRSKESRRTLSLVIHRLPFLNEGSKNRSPNEKEIFKWSWQAEWVIKRHFSKSTPVQKYFSWIYISLQTSPIMANMKNTYKHLEKFTFFHFRLIIRSWQPEGKALEWSECRYTGHPKVKENEFLQTGSKKSVSILSPFNYFKEHFTRSFRFMQNPKALLPWKTCGNFSFATKGCWTSFHVHIIANSNISHLLWFRRT